MKVIKKIPVEEKILSVIEGGEILFIIPPFARSCKGALLDPHLLQALAEKKGFKTDILYLNVLLASVAGLNLSERISNSPRYWMLGERLFARSAHDLPPLGHSPELCWNEALSISGSEENHVKTFYEMENFFHQPSYLKLEGICYDFINDAAEAIAALRYKILWSTVGWEQTNSTIALFKRVKKTCPEVLTLTGGMNTEGEMAEGIASLGDVPDFVFSGEVELSFQEFLGNYTTGHLPPGRVIPCAPVNDLDALPLPDYETFFSQMNRFFDNDPPETLALSYETSRGCWKGEKKRCTFCGLNSSEGIKYRFKTAETAAGQLTEISRRHPRIMVFMKDHIFPYSYYQDLLPALDLPEKFSIRYEVLPNMKPRELAAMKSAGITRIQPGIEALSPNLLDLMHKGISAASNVSTLRYARCAGLSVYWYLLWGFPGDKVADYEALLTLLPLIRHLQPPVYFDHIRLERFSAYVQDPGVHGITNIRPWAVYKMVFPDGAEVEKLANRFSGEYRCESHDHPTLMEEIADAVYDWGRIWQKASLTMTPFADYYVIRDTRGLGGSKKNHILEESRAKEIIRAGEYSGSECQRWALDEKLAVVLDSKYVPLVTALPELLPEFGA